MFTLLANQIITIQISPRPKKAYRALPMQTKLKSTNKKIRVHMTHQILQRLKWINNKIQISKIIHMLKNKNIPSIKAITPKVIMRGNKNESQAGLRLHHHLRRRNTFNKDKSKISINNRIPPLSLYQILMFLKIMLRMISKPTLCFLHKWHNQIYLKCLLEWRYLHYHLRCSRIGKMTQTALFMDTLLFLEWLDSYNHLLLPWCLWFLNGLLNNNKCPLF